MRINFPLDEIQRITGYDPWFLGEIETIIRTEERVRQEGLPKDAKALRALKSMGFSDARLAKLTGQKEAQVRAARHALDIRPCYKRIDTCAAEFAALTPYMYSSYEESGRRPDRLREQADGCQEDHHPGRRTRTASARASSSTIAVAMPPFRCRSAAMRPSWSTAIPRPSPPTIDTSDRLYFEPLTLEDVLEIIHKERERARWPA